MEPITRDEMFMAAAAGEYDGEIPAPITRSDYYWAEIIRRINDGGSVSPEQIDAAIESYFNSHDADIVTEQELTDKLSGYYNKKDIDNALADKADKTDIPDTLTFDNVPTENSNNPVKSGGIYNALSEKADATAIQTALNAKQNALTAGTNLSMSEVTINHTASGVTAGTYGASTKVPQISLDAQGHITQISEKTVMAVADLTGFSPNCFCRTDVNLGAVNINNIDDFISSYGIASGNYSADICVGAYFTSSYDGVDTVFRVAGFDLYLWSGTERNHIIVLPDYQLTTAAMNSSNTTSGGYYGSDMFNTVLGGNSTASGINNKLYNIFGNHLFAYTDLLSTNVDTNATSKANPITKGAVCDWTGTSVYANLLSGTHLWGENISGSGICDYGVPVGQFPLFRFEPKYIINRNTSGNKNRYWLRNIYVTNIFAACNDNGTTAGKSMDSTVGVRPFFLLG